MKSIKKKDRQAYFCLNCRFQFICGSGSRFLLLLMATLISKKREKFNIETFIKKKSN